MGKNKKNRNRAVSPSSETTIQENQRSSPSYLPLRTKFMLVAFVAILAALIYSGSLGHDYAYDDLAVLKENRFVQKGLDGIGEILSTQYFEGYDPNTNARAYRPVSLITYAFEVEYAGLNPRDLSFYKLLDIIKSKCCSFFNCVFTVI